MQIHLKAINMANVFWVTQNLTKTSLPFGFSWAPRRRMDYMALEKAMAPHCSTLAGKSHGRRSLVGCSPRGREELDTTEWLHFHFSLSCIGEGNGNPLQCSSLENPRDRGAWWVAIYGVIQSRTKVKRLRSISSRSSSSSSRDFIKWGSHVCIY